MSAAFPTWEDYRSIIDGCVAGVRESIAAGQDRSDALHEVCDGALCYTRDQWCVLWYSEHEDAGFDAGHEVSGDSVTSIMGPLAYYALVADVEAEL